MKWLRKWAKAGNMFLIDANFILARRNNQKFSEGKSPTDILTALMLADHPAEQLVYIKKFSIKLLFEKQKDWRGK